MEHPIRKQTPLPHLFLFSILILSNFHIHFLNTEFILCLEKSLFIFKTFCFLIINKMLRTFSKHCDVFLWDNIIFLRENEIFLLSTRYMGTFSNSKIFFFTICFCLLSCLELIKTISVKIGKRSFPARSLIVIVIQFLLNYTNLTLKQEIDAIQTHHEHC